MNESEDITCVVCSCTGKEPKLFNVTIVGGLTHVHQDMCSKDFLDLAINDKKKHWLVFKTRQQFLEQ